MECVNNSDKLRTYSIFKLSYDSEDYVRIVTNRQHRSPLAQLRCGILPLKIETGRFQNIPLEYRLCILCNQEVIESQSHFLLHCDRYRSLRQEFLTKIIYNQYPTFDFLSSENKLMSIMQGQQLQNLFGNVMTKGNNFGAPLDHSGLTFPSSS